MSGTEYRESSGLCDGKNIFIDSKDGNYCRVGLEKITLPENGALTSIGAYAFNNCEFTTINIPNTLETIGDNSFRGSGLLEVEIPSTVNTIGANAFDESQLTKVTVGAKLIKSSAFNNSEITNVTIQHTVEMIEDSAFNNNMISSLTIEDTTSNPSRLKSIGSFVFAYNNLSKVIIPGSTNNIGNSLFYENPNLTEIIIKRTQEDAIANITFGNTWNSINGGETFVTVTYNPNYTE